MVCVCWHHLRRYPPPPTYNKLKSLKVAQVKDVMDDDEDDGCDGVCDGVCDVAW